MVYDFIVLGGGISGLYCTYLLLHQFPKKNILLLEKDNAVGGRVYTYSDKYMTVEAGAGRFSSHHNLLLHLLRELGLNKKIASISGDSGYAPADGSTPNIIHGKSILSYGYISKVVQASKREPVHSLQNISFLDYAKKILQPNEVDYITASFGYYSELVLMNAHDAIHLMGELGPTNDFYVLIGGLSQIIDKIHAKIDKYAGSHILCNKTVIDIRARPSTAQTPTIATAITTTPIIEVYCKENQRPYLCTQCICALPKQVTENFPICKPYKPLFRQIVCAPLCRIYCTYPLINGKVWFSGLSKFTTNNNLRMVIPISEEQGVIMISYSDNKYANRWNRLYNTKGVDAVNRELAKLIKQSIGIDIPKPLATKVFYWTCGVGYWGIGADSAAFPLHPNKSIPFYLCGEHYSAKSQQWIEGALETATRVVSMIMSDHTEFYGL